MLFSLFNKFDTYTGTANFEASNLHEIGGDPISGFVFDQFGNCMLRKSNEFLIVTS